MSSVKSQDAKIFSSFCHNHENHDNFFYCCFDLFMVSSLTFNFAQSYFNFLFFLVACFQFHIL